MSASESGSSGTVIAEAQGSPGHSGVQPRGDQSSVQYTRIWRLQIKPPTSVTLKRRVARTRYFC